MKSLSLALVRQRYAEDGGAERFVARLLDALSGQDVRVTLITRRWQGSSGFDVMTLDPFFIGRLWRDWSFARAVSRIIGERRFDLVQSHERIAGCDIYRAGDGVHREWLAQRARTLRTLGRFALAINPYHRYVLAAERRLFQNARLRAIICNSQMVKREIMQHFALPEDRLHVIYNGVDTDLFHPNLKRERHAVRRRLEIPADAPLLLFVGSGFERKGLTTLLTAMRELPSTHLLVVGRDKQSARFERRAHACGVSAHAHFVGPQRDVKPYYGAADTFVLPTLYDPFPNAALEALASGLPVITSTKCGAAELINDGDNGYVVDALDVAALVRAIDAASRPEHRQALALAARRTAEAFAVTRMTQRFLAFYRVLTETAPAR